MTYLNPINNFTGNGLLIRGRNRAVLEEIAEAVYRWIANEDAIIEQVFQQRPIQPCGTGSGLKLFIITGSEEIEPDSNRWRYSFVEGKFDKDEEKFVPKEGGVTSTVEEDDFADPLYNLFESHNDGGGYEGVGIVVGEDAETGSYVEMLPLMSDLVVPAWRHDEVWMCAVPNPLSVSCESEEEVNKS